MVKRASISWVDLGLAKGSCNESKKLRLVICVETFFILQNPCNQLKQFSDCLKNSELLGINYSELLEKQIE
jgi:hypothetical protein